MKQQRIHKLPVKAIGVPERGGARGASRSGTVIPSVPRLVLDTAATRGGAYETDKTR